MSCKSLRLVLPPQPDPVVENFGRVFARQIQGRCDAMVVTQGEAPLVVELAIEPGLGTEGYAIVDGADGAVRIRGNDTRGLLYGVGKFLHTSAYGHQGFTPGHLFFYNGNAAEQVVGKTELAPETWNHVVLVRDGRQIAVDLNGHAEPEIAGGMETGYPDGVTQLFVGGRNDNFANFRGKMAGVSVYDRALTCEEAVRHFQAAGLQR